MSKSIESIIAQLRHVMREYSEVQGRRTFHARQSEALFKTASDAELRITSLRRELIDVIEQEALAEVSKAAKDAILSQPVIS
jgi:hypothetical protein